MNTTAKETRSFTEFIVLMALMMSLVALSIDAMLPALSQIGESLNVTESNKLQLIVSTMFLGLALGQLLFGPLSDSFGRRPIIFIGYFIFTIGSVVSVFATDLTVLLLGRFLQGFGVAAPRVLTTTIVRDQFSGREMAKVMSFIMMIFILVPMVAPLIGQAILLVSTWRMIFIVVLLVGLVSLLWFYWRQPETLEEENRIPFSVIGLAKTAKQVLLQPITLGYTLISGVVLSAFLGYLSSAPQLFQIKYALGEWFSVYFALLALSLGVASFLNGKIVVKYGMKLLVKVALIILAGLSISALCISVYWQGLPPLLLITIYFVLSFLCIGILFGNIQALAMEPLGKMAGTGAAVIGSVSTLVALPAGVYIGQSFSGTAYPLLIAFSACSIICLIIMGITEKKREC